MRAAVSVHFTLVQGALPMPLHGIERLEDDQGGGGAFDALCPDVVP